MKSCFHHCDPIVSTMKNSTITSRFSKRYSYILDFQDPFPLSSFPDVLPPDFNTSWGFCDPSAGCGTWPCWTSYNWPQSIYSVCPHSFLHQFNTPVQFGAVCELSVTLIPSSKPSMKILNRTSFSNEPGQTCDQPSNGFNSIPHYSLGLAIQPFFLTVKSIPIHTIGSQFLQDNTVGDNVKSLSEF